MAWGWTRPVLPDPAKQPDLEVVSKNPKLNKVIAQQKSLKPGRLPLGQEARARFILIFQAVRGSSLSWLPVLVAVGAQKSSKRQKLSTGRLFIYRLSK